MKKPNILVFMTDHQRGDTVYPYNRAITPNVDAIAKEGISFSQCHTVAPHCCPSRASFFSGLYPSEHGVWNNVNVENALSKGLYEGVRLFSEDLSDNGYELYFSGKWHVSYYESPLDRGFHHMECPKPNNKNSKTKYGQKYRHTRPDPTNTWEKNYKNFKQKDISERKEGEIIRNYYPLFTLYGEEEYPKNDYNIVMDAIKIIENRDTDKPWFQFVGVNGPHDPYFVPKRFLDMYDINDIELPPNFEDDMEDKPALYRRTRDRFSQLTRDEYREAIRHYLALCSYEDYLFGLIIEKLKEKGQYENTMIIYLSDHGDYMGEHGLWAKGLPCFKGAYHIPCVIKWDEGIKNPGRVVDDYVCITDFAPTFLEIAGINVDRKFEGRSLVPYFEDRINKNKRTEIYTQSNGNEVYGIQRSVWTDKYKLVFNAYDYDELYDLEKDPFETKNLINEKGYEKVKKELYKKLWQFAYDNNDACVNPYIMTALAEYGPAVIFE